MKNLLTVLLLANLALFSGSAYATNYYFSSTDGDDSRSSAEAQNSATPWKTLSKLNSIFSSLQPGDQILFKRGDVFYGSIIATKAGTSSQHITFSAYGSGAKPIITGFTQVTSWTNAGGSIWQSSSAISTLGTTNIVAVNGVNTPMGRTPNTGSYYSITSHTSSSVTIGSISGANYKGAEVVFKTAASWIMSRNLITSQSGTTLSFIKNYPNPFGFTIYDPANSQAFIQNALSTLDAQNEWYYDPSTKKLNIYSSSSPTGVRIATIDSLVKLSAGYLTFDNLDFEGANTDCFQLSNATDITIQNCDIQYCGDKGVDQMNNNPNLTVTNCTFKDIQNSGITNVGYSGNTGMTISGNSFSNINMIPGAWGSVDGTNMAIGIYDSGANDVVQNNSIDSCGYIGIFAMGQSFTVKNNFVNHFCFYNTDGGGIYTGNHGTNRQILNNIVLNGMTGAAHGIYCDDNASNVTISGNSVYKAVLGIYLHNAHEITVQNNTVYNCSGASLSMGHDANDAVRNVSLSQNILVLTSSVSQGNCSYQTSETSQTNFGTSDNNYICKPIGTDDNAWFTALQGATFNHYTLPQWQSTSTLDKNSKKSPKSISSISDLRFEYNATTSNKTVNLGATYMDVTGKNYAGSITLAPYTSAVLIYVSGTVANQPPVANAGQDQNLSSPTSSTTLAGSGSDPDGTISSYQWTKVSGPAQFTIASATLAKTGISNLVEGVYQFELKVTDNSGATAADTVTVTISAASNQSPVAKAGNSQSITLPTNSVSLDGSSSNDPDGTIASYQWTKILGPSSAVILNPNLAATTITSLVQGVYQFELKVTDNLGAVGKDTVQITVGGAPNQAPTADAGLDINITLPTNSVNLSGTGTDVDGTIASYQWTKVSGPSQYAIASPGQAQTTANSLIEGIYTFELKVTDNAGASGKDTVRITVNPSPIPNQPPSADAGLDINITLPNNSVTLAGTGTDGDGTIVSYQWNKISGPSQYSISSPTQSSTSVNNLAAGTYQFQLTVTDNSGAGATDIVQVTVNAAPNQPPVADAGTDIDITLPTNSTTLAGSGNDPDGSIVSYQWTKISGPSSYSISLPTRTRTTIDNLVEGTYEFQLQVTDNSGAVATDIVQVTVHGATPQPNQNPAANAGPDLSITLPTNNVTLNGSGTDPDGSITSYQWTMISGPAQYNITSATQARTSVDNLAEGVYQFQLQVTDDQGATNADVVQITVNAAPPPPNQAPTDNAGADVVIYLPTNNTTLSGSGTDPDGWMASYQWRKISGPSQYNITSPNTAQTSVNNLAQGVYAFELTATDNSGATAKDTVLVTVNAAPNQSPSADAGIDINITLPTNSTTLSGAGTDPDGTITSYRWSKIAGPAQYSLGSSTFARTSLTNLAQGSYSFELTVTDNSGASAKDTVNVTVNAAVTKPNQIPEANAGPDVQITLPTNSTRLSGSGSDPDGSISSFRWRSVSGPKEFTINSSTRASTTVSNLVKGTYTFELTVTDNLGATDKDTMVVNVLGAPVNQAPKANAGADVTITLPTNSTSLSGSGSDPDGTISSYKWAKVSGPSQYNFNSSTRALTSVNNLAKGVYLFELTVTDNAGKTGKDTMQVTVNAAVNQAPTANAGLDINTTLPTNSVILSGSGTDPDGTIASYRWNKISGPADFSIVSATQARTTVNNLIDGTYQFELTVTDNGGKTAKDTVQVIVNPPSLSANHSPTADAGTNIDITLPTNSVKLSGQGKDMDGTVTSYKWKKSAGPNQYNIASSDKAETEVTNLEQGVYQFELTVTDNSNASARSTMQVTVHAAPNQAPTANAGADLQISLPTDTATLNGTGSSDPDGTISSYKWTKISGAGQSTLASPLKSQTLISNLTEGIYQFELTVTDNAGMIAKDTVEVIVLAVPKAFAKLFPNPATSTINIQIEGAGRTSNTSLRIYDSKGILVYQEDFVRPPQPMIKQVNVNRLPAGIYFVELQTDTNNITTLRFMKK